MVRTRLVFAKTVTYIRILQSLPRGCVKYANMEGFNKASLRLLGGILVLYVVILWYRNEMRQNFSETIILMCDHDKPIYISIALPNLY